MSCNDQIKIIVMLFSLFLIFNITAKESNNETDIVCFAAKSKWVCAPKDEQEIAKQKAQLLVKVKNKPNTSTQSDVVITTLDSPSFEPKAKPKASRPNPMDFFKVNPSKKSKASSQETSSIKVPADSKVIKNNSKSLNNSDDINANNMWSYQLIGLSTQQNAINFVNSNSLPKDLVRIVKSERNNNEWWIVLYGLYENKESAQKDDISLLSKISKPWLRPLENLKIKGYLKEY